MGTVLFLLVLILAVHIYMVTGKTVSEGPNWSMGKIEVTDQLDSLSVNEIKQDFLDRPYIRAFRANLDQGHLILLYDRKQVSGDDLAAELGAKLNLQANIYRPSAEELASSCPAMPKDSFTYQLGSLFQSIFTK